MFAAALREALRAAVVDLAVQKGPPDGSYPGLVVAVVPARADAGTRSSPRRRTLGELLPGARIGTGAPRRIAQLAALIFGHRCIGLRGNVRTEPGG